MYPMKNQIFRKMGLELNRMKDAGKVDLGFLDHILEFKHYLNKIKTRWLENPNNDGFYFYQAAYNMELIADQMYARFEDAGKTKDRSVVADDALALLPQFDKTLDLLESSDISTASIDKILDQTGILRDVAADKNLLEPIEVDRKSIDVDNLRSNFTALMRHD